jgi:hypothetical protein
MSPIYDYDGEVWIRTQNAAVAGWRTTELVARLTLNIEVENANHL